MTRRHLITAVAVLFAMFLARPIAAQNVAIKVNALNWALASPDFGLEMVTGERTSLGLSLTANYKPYGINMRAIGATPEFRYWISGRPLTRSFVGVAIFGTMYDMNFTQMCYKGSALGGGLIGGYAFELGQHWSLELSAGCGLLAYKQKQYSPADVPPGAYVEPYRQLNYGYSFAPMKLGVTFIYIIR